jgi:hypothetical protein
MGERAVVRTGRAAVFSAVCVSLAAAAHSYAAHTWVPARGVVIGLAVVFVFARIAASRERGVGAIAALLLGGQAGLHVLFGAVMPQPPMPGMAAMAGIRHTHLPAAHAMPDETAAMIAGHVVAALLVAWWLRCGEAALFRLVRSAARRVYRRWLPAGGPLPGLRIAPGRGWADVLLAPAARAIRFALVRRGPPRVAVTV